jgi:hypothetical protein
VTFILFNGINPQIYAVNVYKNREDKKGGKGFL